MKLNIVKQLNGTFKVAFDSDYEVLKKIKVGKVYQVDIKNQRNAKFHRKFWALINIAYNNQNHYNSLEQFRKDLTIASGFYEQHETFNGKVRTEAKSIAFNKMDEMEFERLYNSFLDCIQKYFNIDSELLDREVLSQVNES